MSGNFGYKQRKVHTCRTVCTFLMSLLLYYTEVTDARNKIFELQARVSQLEMYIYNLSPISFHQQHLTTFVSNPPPPIHNLLPAAQTCNPSPTYNPPPPAPTYNPPPPAYNPLPPTNNPMSSSRNSPPTFSENPILHEQLADPKSVIKNKPKLLTKANIGRLTIKPANESYFAPHLLDTCTVHGNRDLTALPKDKLQSLKQFLCTTNPEFIGNRVVFEAH